MPTHRCPPLSLTLEWCTLWCICPYQRSSPCLQPHRQQCWALPSQPPMQFGDNRTSVPQHSAATASRTNRWQPPPHFPTSAPSTALRCQVFFMSFCYEKRKKKHMPFCWADCHNSSTQLWIYYLRAFDAQFKILCFTTILWPTTPKYISLNANFTFILHVGSCYADFFFLKCYENHDSDTRNCDRDIGM